MALCSYGLYSYGPVYAPCGDRHEPVTVHSFTSARVHASGGRPAVCNRDIYSYDADVVMAYIVVASYGADVVMAHIVMVLCMAL